MALFRVPRRHELRQFEVGVNFSRPKHIASFSRIKGQPNTRKLGGSPPVYKEAKVGESLTKGFDQAKWPVDDSTLQDVIDTIRETEADILSGFKGFVTYRNNLNKILGTPYLRNNYSIRIRRTKEGWIRLDIVKTPDPTDTTHRRFMYMGRRFEEISVKNPSNREHCVVCKLRLHEHELLVAAEIDAILPKSNPDTSDEKASPSGKSIPSTDKFSGEWVELKTSKHIQHHGQLHSFQKYKLLKFWIQSFLVGVPVIKCAFRKDEKIHKIETFETLKIPSIIRGKDYWSGNVCLGFARKVLSFIRAHVREPDKEYILEYDKPWDAVRLYEASASKSSNDSKVS
ncbi:hypothetical protein AAMO2058_000289500 [Amorphochlora amoebiformis]